MNRASTVFEFCGQSEEDKPEGVVRCQSHLKPKPHVNR